MHFGQILNDLEPFIDRVPAKIKKLLSFKLKKASLLVPDNAHLFYLQLI